MDSSFPQKHVQCSRALGDLARRLHHSSPDMSRSVEDEFGKYKMWTGQVMALLDIVQRDAKRAVRILDSDTTAPPNGSDIQQLVESIQLTITSLHQLPICCLDPVTNASKVNEADTVTVSQRVKIALNMLSLESGDEEIERASDQLIAIATAESNIETSALALRIITENVYHRGCSDPGSSRLCARLCQVLSSKVPLEIIDHGTLDYEGRPVSGGNLFRKYLLNGCQFDFESSAKQNPSHGLVQFIGELYKARMLTDRIIDEVFFSLAGTDGVPNDSRLGATLELLWSVGPFMLMRQGNAPNMIITFFRRMDSIRSTPGLSGDMKGKIEELSRNLCSEWAGQALRERRKKQIRARVNGTTPAATLS